MSKEFSQFPFKNTLGPLEGTDRYLIGVPDLAAPHGFSNYLVEFSEIKTYFDTQYDLKDTAFFYYINSIGYTNGAILAHNADPNAHAGRFPVFFPETSEDPDEPMMIPGPKGAVGPAGPGTINNNNNIFMSMVDGFDGEDAEPIPGQRGATGIGTPGVSGIDGRNAPFMLPEDPAEPDEPQLIPGRNATNGTNGINGIDGRTIFMLPDTPDDPDEPMLMKGIPGVQGIPGINGSTSFVMLPSESQDEPDEPFQIPPIPFPDPFIGRNTPGSFTIPNDRYVVTSRRLQITSTQRISLIGSARLRIT